MSMVATSPMVKHSTLLGLTTLPHRDAYPKKTCLWTGNGFNMPYKVAVECDSFGSSTQHRKLGGKSMKTKNIRSATPRGFARAVVEANAV